MKNLFKLVLLLLIVAPVYSQQKRLTVQQIDTLPNTVKNQFLKIYSKGNSWRTFKMVDKAEFVKFQNNILDSIANIKSEVTLKEKTLIKKEANIISLKSDIEKLQTDLSTSVNKEDSISFFGTLINKKTYNSILWGIIGLLVVALSFFIYKYKNNIASTKQSKLDLEEVETEFESFRKKSLEREQKLRRQLLDETNKNKS